MEEKKLCSSCGRELKPGAGFCIYCGAAVTAKEEPTAETPAETAVDLPKEVKEEFKPSGEWKPDLSWEPKPLVIPGIYEPDEKPAEPAAPAAEEEASAAPAEEEPTAAEEAVPAAEESAPAVEAETTAAESEPAGNTCPMCGRELRQGALFCTECGAAVMPADVSVTPVVNAFAAEPEPVPAVKESEKKGSYIPEKQAFSPIPPDRPEKKKKEKSAAKPASAMICAAVALVLAIVCIILISGGAKKNKKIDQLETRLSNIERQLNLSNQRAETLAEEKEALEAENAELRRNPSNGSGAAGSNAYAVEDIDEAVTLFVESGLAESFRANDGYFADRCTVVLRTGGKQTVTITFTEPEGTVSKEMEFDSGVASATWGNWFGDDIDLTVNGLNAGADIIHFSNDQNGETFSILVIVLD